MVLFRGSCLDLSHHAVRTFKKPYGEFYVGVLAMVRADLSDLPEQRPSSIPALGDGVTRNLFHLVKGVDIICAQFDVSVLFSNPQNP